MVPPLHGVRVCCNTSRGLRFLRSVNENCGVQDGTRLESCEKTSIFTSAFATYRERQVGQVTSAGKAQMRHVAMWPCRANALAAWLSET